MRRREFAFALGSSAFLSLSPIRVLRRVARRSTHAINPPSDEFVQRLPLLMEVAGVPGIAMSVVQDERVVWEHHAGVADARNGKPVSQDTLWPAASLGKPVFALAALRLVDAQKLALDAPLATYLPGYAPDDARANRITARHVLSHSSGLPNWRRADDDRLVPAFDPGTRFRYSGEGYFYLQRVVEHITGMAFEQFMEQSLFASLNMTSSTYSWRPDMASRVVAGQDRDDTYTVFWQNLGNRLLGESQRQGRELATFTTEDIIAAVQGMTPPQRTLPNFLIPNAASSLVTTPSDYSGFLIAVLGGHSNAAGLSRVTHDAMLVPQIQINSALAWGLGWGLELKSLTIGTRTPTVSAMDFIWHWGDNGSWKNFVLAHPASRSGIVIFTNSSRGLHVARRITTEATGLDHLAFASL